MTYIIEEPVQIAFDLLAAESKSLDQGRLEITEILQNPVYSAIIVHEKNIPKKIKKTIHPVPEISLGTLLTHCFSHNPANIFKMFGERTVKFLLENDDKRQSFINGHHAIKNEVSFDDKEFEMMYFINTMANIAEKQNDFATLTTLGNFKAQTKSVTSSAHLLAEIIEVTAAGKYQHAA